MKNVIHQIDSKNEWLVLSSSFTAKFDLAFGLTLENAFSQRFHFKVNSKSIVSSKKRYYGFLKGPSVERSACFYMTTTENFERFQYFNFATNFHENEIFFEKLEYRLLVKTTKIENATFSIKNCHIRNQYQDKWNGGVQHGPIAKNGVLPVTTLFF